MAYLRFENGAVDLIDRARARLGLKGILLCLLGLFLLIDAILAMLHPLRALDFFFNVYWYARLGIDYVLRPLGL